ncbi:MAG: sulfatase [Myxococcota bacterium]
MSRALHHIGFVIRSLAVAFAALAIVAGLALAWVYVSSWRYQQLDDTERVGGKDAYLARVASSGFSTKTGSRRSTNASPPNIVLILFDDLGFGDLGSYGARAIRTPRLDRLAEHGVRLTDFYSAAPVCSPARAGLLTGRYPIRTRITQVPMTPGGTVGAPLSSVPLYELQRAVGVATRLPLEEITLAEVLQAAGYATGMFGKWHLGTGSPSLPNDRGFETFAGLLSSNDQYPNPFYRDREVIEPSPVDQTTLTQRYTDGAVEFIEAHSDEPFFLYLPHTFPHQPLHPSAQQHGRSPAGLYGDVVADLDRSVGRVLDALARAGIEEQTLVVVTSDNGPWFQGSPGQRRGRKTDLFDGGFGVPFIARWPGTLPAGVVRSEMAMGIDVFPTVLSLAGIDLPGDRIIDGLDMLPMLRDGDRSAHEALYFYWAQTLGAVRSGNFKYHDRRPIPVGYAPAPLMLQIPMGPWLFDLSRDPDESYDVIDRHPDLAARLAALLGERRKADRANSRGFL